MNLSQYGEPLLANEPRKVKRHDTYDIPAWTVVSVLMRAIPVLSDVQIGFTSDAGPHAHQPWPWDLPPTLVRIEAPDAFVRRADSSWCRRDRMRRFYHVNAYG